MKLYYLQKILLNKLLWSLLETEINEYDNKFIYERDFYDKKARF